MLKLHVKKVDMIECETCCFSARFWVNLATYHCTLRKCWTRQSNSFLPLSACTCSVHSSRRQSANHILSKILSLPPIQSLQRGRVRLQVRGWGWSGAPRSGTAALRHPRCLGKRCAATRLPNHKHSNNQPPQLFETAHNPYNYFTLIRAIVVLKLKYLMKCSWLPNNLFCLPKW